ncbi:MAG TPA: TonB-dependent receptor [Longimicrobiales bacterium]
MRARLTACAAAMLAVALPGAVLAQRPSGLAWVVIEQAPRIYDLESVVVTASRRAELLKNATIATTVIDGDALRATGASDLASVLTEQAGVQLEGGHPAGSGVMLQGLGSERVLVLVDGEPVIGRISGQLDVSRIPTSIIERVEVVMGPQSTLYGSDAMGGVINVITRAAMHARTPNDDGLRDAGIMMTAGSRGRLDASADVRGRVSGVAYSLNGGRRSVDLVPGQDGTAGTTATRYDGGAQLSWKPDPATSFDAKALVLDEQQRWRSGALYQFADNLEWQARAGARVLRGRHSFAPALYGTVFEHLSRRATGPEPVAGSGERETQQLAEAELMYGYSGDVVSVDAGGEARVERIRSDRVAGDAQQNTALEPFAQVTITHGALRVMPGARMSWSEQWGTHWTPRVAAMLHATDRLTLRASVGQGYRAPSFKELHMEFLNDIPGAGYRVRGNPALQPETSRNVTAGVQWSGSSVEVSTQLFYNRFDDFIETRELADSGGLRLFTYDNVQDGTTYGSDVQLRWMWNGVRADAGYAYLVAKDNTTDTRLPGRPTHSGRLAVTAPLPMSFNATVTGLYTGASQVVTDDDQRVGRDGFARLDVRLARDLPAGLNAFAGIDNITGTQPDAWPGYAGRQFHLGLGWRIERFGAQPSSPGDS